ncbi:response regulator [Thermodesulfobacteriota bacterium]
MEDKTIIIVDDDLMLADNLQDILQDEGYTVHCAGTCSEGRSLAAKVKPQAALLDERLPDGTGTQLLADLRKLDPECFCVIMTAHADLESVMTAIERGVFHYLMKPVGPAELLHVLKRVFDTIGLRVEKRLAEQALKESERRFREILQNVRMVSVCVDVDGTITFSNDFLLEHSGWRRSDVVGKNWFDLFVPPDRSASGRAAYMIKIRAGNIPAHGESRIITRDGSMRILSWNNTVLRNPSGRIIGLASIGEDITELKQTVAALKESEDRLKIILDRIQAGIVLVDSQTHLIVDANPVAVSLIAAEKEEVIGSRLNTYFRDLELDLGPGAHLGRRIEKAETRLFRDDGLKLPVLYTVVPTMLNGKPHLVGSFIDLTDRKALEEEQLKAEKLEALGLLAGGIAHDFNNLLTGILGNITLAGMYVEGGGKAHKRLLEAQRAAVRAKDLTQQLLIFASGGAPVKKTVSVDELLRDSAGFVLRGSKSRSVLKIKPNLWLANIDQGQITQVIYNLVINADHAMAEGGDITIEAENVIIESDSGIAVPEGKYIRISVIDCGSGISREDLKRVFDPYFTTKRKGSGLGLTTSYSIVKNHGGTIVVESEEGEGATFHVYLPASINQVPDTSGKQEKPIYGKGKILVMDDEEVIRDLMSDLLANLGYEAVFAADGKEAIEVYRIAEDSGRPFDVVIMDLTIPGGMGGKATMEALVRIDPDVKAIVSSGYSNDPIMSDYRSYGFIDVMAKPYGVAELSGVLHRVIHGGG